MITDDTLREGMQTPGMAFTIEEKLKLAMLISEAGIKRALVSYPVAHISEYEVTEKIIKNRYFDETFGLGRTIKEDIDRIYSTGANISLHLPFKIDDINIIKENVRYASKKGKKLEIGIVDIDQYNIHDLIKICNDMEESGANILQIPDTKGVTSPEKYGKIIKILRRSIKTEIEIHCHNDAGYSVMNAYEGLKSGADYIDTTLFGTGERNGISDSMVISKMLNDRKIEDIDMNKLKIAYDYMVNLILKKIGNEFFMDNYPLYGKNTSIHTAGTHASFGNIFKGKNYSVNAYTGRSMIKNILIENKINFDESKLNMIVNKIKDYSSETGRALELKDIVKISGEVN